MRFRFVLAACYFAAFTVVGLGSSSLLPSANAQVFSQPKHSAPPSTPKARPRSQPAMVLPTPAARQAPPSKSTPQVSTFREPATYCSVNPNIDEPGSTYVGQPVPGWVSSAWAGDSKASAGTMQNRAFNWRCMGGRVLVCSNAVGQSDCGKPIDERSPSPEMLQFCSGKRKAAVAQDLVGNALPIWVCRDGKPVITGYRTGLDERGYFSAQWRDVTDYSPANMVATVPHAFIGDWNSTVMGQGYLFKIPYNVVVKIRGGGTNKLTGSIDYYSKNFSGQFAFFCSSELYLRAGNTSALNFEERIKQRGPDGRCPSQDNITLQSKDGQMRLEWRKNSDPQVTMSGLANR